MDGSTPRKWRHYPNV